VAGLAADARNTLPIMAKTMPTNPEMMGQSTKFIVQTAVAGPSGHGEPRAEISHAHQFIAATPQESPTLVELESSIVNLIDGATEQHIEHLSSNTVSGSSRVAEPSHPDELPTVGSSRTSIAGNAGPPTSISTMGPPIEPVAPLVMSANRWVATSTRHNGSDVEGDALMMVERKVKALVNKLTMERFDSISDQIIAWANKSEREKDGRTLIQVIKLVFEKATDEATFSEMYARLCRKMMEQISPKVQDDGIKNAEGKPFAGGQLFRKYLLNRCQEDFERGWVAKETTAAAAASKATADLAVKEANEKTKGEESELYSEEYYAAAKAKRRGLGLIRFIGELFKLQMLTERIMHECIKKLLGNVENPEEEEIESLCKLLSTVGSLLDTQKARAHLDVYFSRMKELTKNKNVNSRMIFMLQVSGTMIFYVHDQHRPVPFLRMSSNSVNVDGFLVMPWLRPRLLLKSMKR
jgi:hypothetical protein